MKKGSAGLGSFAKAYREGAKTVAAMSKYHTSDDFTVVEQPYYDNFTFPTKTDGSPDASFFAPDHVRCFFGAGYIDGGVVFC